MKKLKTLFSCFAAFSSLVSGVLSASSCYSYANDCCWQDFCWDYCDGPSRVYAGPVYYHKKITVESVPVDEIAISNNFALPYYGEAKGNIWGVNVGYEFREACNVYFNLDTVWSSGDLKGDLYDRMHSMHKWDVEGRLGYTFGSCGPCVWTVSPYVGLGYSWIKYTLETQSITMKYRNYYVPVGVFADIEVMCDFNVGLDIAWLPQFNPKLLVEGFGGDIDVASENGWRVWVPVTYRICPDWGFELTVIPFWELNYNGNGDAVYTGTETKIVSGKVAKIKNTDWGARFLFAFRF